MIYAHFLSWIFAVIVISTIKTNGQRFSLRGQFYPNHGLVLREDIGETDNGDLDPDNGLHCIGFDGCCVSPVPSNQRGEYVIPGTMTNVPVLDTIGASGYYRNRRSDRIFLNRRGGTTQGIFQCQIRTESTQTILQTFYIGVYDAGSGTPSITGITFNNVDTLTCTSSGGPATSVKWRRNCLLLQSNDTNFVQGQTVTSTASATYENTLKLPSTDNDGVYTCSVSNIRGYSNDLIGVGADYTPLPVDVTITAGGTPVAGQSFTLTCQATTSLSNPTYQWFSDSGTMIGSSSTLTIDPLLESGTGEYSCQVSADSGASQRYGCGVERVAVQAPALTVTVNNVGNAVAGTSHTLSCSVSGANLGGATMTYVWQLNGVNITGVTSSTYDITHVQLSDAGGVYTCRVTVMASYWDVSGSFEGSGSGTLMVSINNPTIQFTRLTLGTIYVGLSFTMRCDVEIPGSQLQGVTADVEWRGPGGSVLTNTSRITVGGVMETTPGREYQSSLTFTPLSSVDTGSYNCSATIRPTVANGNVNSGVGTGSESLTVTSTTVSVSVQRTNIPTKLLDLPSYNGFSLTCTATSRASTQDVALTKVITWMRSVGGGNPRELTESSTSDVIMISNMNLNQATATSELIVNTTSSGSHVYTCAVSVHVSPATDVIQRQNDTTIVVQGEAPPNPPTALVARDVTHNSATIQWTVTSLAYGPEMYMVEYGTDMNSLGQTSTMVSSGGDITVMNFDLSVGLTGLEMTTQYFYRVVAANDGSSVTTSEMIGTFNTTGLLPDPPTMLQGTPSTDQAAPPSIAFTWAAPSVTNGDILDYQVTCTSAAGLPNAVVTSSTISATLSNLENGARYCCTVTARNAQGSSVPSDAHCTSTVEIAPTGAPQGFAETSGNDPRDVTFTWTLPVLTDRNGDITSYNLTCVSTTTGREAFLTRVYQPDESNRYTLPGFRPFTMHQCRVYAINSAGRGPEASLTFTTLPDEPDGAPQDITVSLVAGDPTQVMFNFNPPREDLQNGEIIEYMISCVDRDGRRAAIVRTPSSSTPRPYTFMSLVPATLYDCSLSARTIVGFGVEESVEVLTVPDRPTIASITPDRTYLLVSWSYTIPPLSEGAVISGYRLYLDNSLRVEVTGFAVTQYNITSLSPFTNYTVQVSAYNTRGEGLRSNAVTTRTLAEFPGPPVCPRRWSSTSLSSLTIDWQPPVQHNGDITGYFLELVTYDNQTVLQSDNVANNTFTYTFNGFTIAAGVPYHVRVYTEDTNGRGRHCVTTDFGDQLSPPSSVLSGISPSYDSMLSGSLETAAVLTWTVLPLDQAKGYISLSITFGPLTNTAARQKRQTSGEIVECAQSPCQVPYEQGRVRILGLDSERDNFIIVIPENEEGEIGTPVATGIAAETQTPPTCTFTCPDTENSAAVSGLGAMVVLFMLLLSVAMAVIVVLLLKLRRSKQYSSADKSGIVTTKCEAYEAMKLQVRPRSPTATSAMYEEVGEHTGGRRGLQAGTTPTLDRSYEQMYDEVRERPGTQQLSTRSGQENEATQTSQVGN